VIDSHAEKYRSATTPSLTVRPLGNIVREMEGPVGLQVCLVQEAYVDAMLTDEMIQFQLLAAKTVGLSISQLQGVSSRLPC
jgi:hypothetical protein